LAHHRRGFRSARLTDRRNSGSAPDLHRASVAVVAELLDTAPQRASTNPAISDHRNTSMSFEAGQESRSRRKIDKLPYWRPGDGRDPLLLFSELSSNGNDLPTIIRSCRGGLDPGLRREDKSGDPVPSVRCLLPGPKLGSGRGFTGSQMGCETPARRGA
jgi:hypothetical protein